MTDNNLCLEGAANFRDFGGYLADDGCIVRRQRLFRSETLSALTIADFGQLARLGLRAVYDLRSKGEREHAPTNWPAHFTPETLLMDLEADLRSGDTALLDILKRDPTEHGALLMMMEVYRSIPHSIQRHLPGLFARLGQEHGVPLLVHCTAGKDRTGVVSALILRALGVSQEDVAFDYLLTNKHRNLAAFEANIAAITEHMLGKSLPYAAVAVLAHAHEAYLDRSFAEIDREYGSFAAYLAHAGVDASLLAQARQRLLQT
ncbi:tyrosine-protein phosphatase [Noviherbaspirillum sedimenti]|nr:tyrosine-protein phosphatase [Noviherbaspirillum sedimenti]